MDPKPTQDRVLIEPVAAKDKSSTGIIIPETAREKPQEGIVRFVGPGKPESPMVLKPGDRVLYSKNVGSEIKIHDISYLVMRETDVWIVI